jgi:diguanylate cyclase (GGDEF)-like protein/PAS domain S-box-containing protein
MLESTARSRRVITGLALVIATVVTVLLPALVWFQGHRKEVVELELLASVFADQITQQAVANDPKLWFRKTLLLTSILSARFEPEHGDEIRFIEDARGRLVVSIGEEPPAPNLTRAVTFIYEGTTVGRVVIVRSQRRVIELTVFALMLGGTLGLAIYFALAHLPMRDIERTIEAMAEEKERARQMFTYARDGMLSYDDHLRVKEVNRAAELLFGRDQAGLVGQPLGSLFDSVGRAGAATGGNPWLHTDAPFEVSARYADGSLVPVEVSVGRVGERKDISHIAIVRNISERKRAESELHRASNFDGLTGLPNRDHFRMLLGEALFRARDGKHRTGLLIVDLSRFKRINDALGHAIGDKLLQAVAKRLRGKLRDLPWAGRNRSGLANDAGLVSRLGGDEFAVILEEMAEGADAERVARELIETVSAPFDIEGHELVIGASVGIAFFPDLADATAGKLMHAADLAMNQAQRMGHNACYVYSEGLGVRRQDRLAKEVRLRRAVSAESFELHYQPILRLDNGRVDMVEALLRWPDGENNVAPPPEFLDILEDTGLIHEVGDWVLRTACRQLRTWHASGFPRLKLAVNVSRQQFSHAELVKRVEAALVDSGLEPVFLQIELDAGALADSVERGQQTLQGLRNLGVTLALDRFGAGAFGLAALQGLPLAALKIDLSFVRDFDQDPAGRALVQSMIDLGRTLELQTVGVGVETEAQRELLSFLGCGWYQGFLATPPMKAKACLTWLERQPPHLRIVA